MESKIRCKHILNLNDILLKKLNISVIKYLQLAFQNYFMIIFKPKEKDQKIKKKGNTSKPRVAEWVTEFAARLVFCALAYRQNLLPPPHVPSSDHSQNHILPLYRFMRPSLWGII